MLYMKLNNIDVILNNKYIHFRLSIFIFQLQRKKIFINMFFKFKKYIIILYQ